jgi:hypothetical protein
MIKAPNQDDHHHLSLADAKVTKANEKIASLLNILTNS